jgi:hypothetical protein
VHYPYQGLAAISMMYPTHIYDLSFLNICNNFCDIGYNPAQQKPNCRSSCGNITVPFPFGIEEGCYAREQFYLNCTNETSSTLLLGYYRVVTEIDVENGLIKYIFPDIYEGSVVEVSSNDPGVFVDSGESVSLKWVVANLTCQEAQANISGYACVSTNSNCIPVNTTNNGYVGYQCKCSNGFEGNPYVKNGCQGNQTIPYFVSQSLFSSHCAIVLIGAKYIYVL